MYIQSKNRTPIQSICLLLLLVAILLILHSLGCDRNGTNQRKKIELTIEQYLQLQDSNDTAELGESEDPDYNRKILIPNCERALVILHEARSNHDFDEPILLRAWINQQDVEGYVYTLSFEWLENGFTTIGFYLGDTTGDIATYTGSDWRMYATAPRENLMRFAFTKLYTTRDHELADSRLRKRIKAPSIDVPKSFEERVLRVGLIVEGGRKTDPLPLIRKSETTDTSGGAHKHIDFMEKNEM